MRTASRLVAAVAMAAAASACTSSVSINDFSKSLVQADCQYEIKCGVFTDEAYCEALFSALPGNTGFNSFGATLDAVKAGKISYDGSAAAKCIDAVSSDSCTQPTNFPDLPGCSAIFKGTLADGASCITDEECKSGSNCVQASSSSNMCAGTCTAAPGSCRSSADCNGKVCDSGQCVTAVPPGASGQPCGTFDSCQSGLVCTQNGASTTCQPIAQANQPCTSSFLGNSCASGLMCIQTDPSQQNGTCLTPKTKGQSCQYLFECGGPASSLVCDPSSKTCIDRPKTGACIQGICDDLSAWCDLSQGASSATCKPFKALGESCQGQQECGTSPDVTCQMANGATSGTCTSTASQACTP